MSSLELKVPPLVVVLIVAGLMKGTAMLTPELLWPMAIRVWGALLLFGLGAGVAFAGVLCFKRAGTTVNPLDPRQSAHLVTSGVYRWSRNPMYAGFLLSLLAWSWYLGNPYSLWGPVAFVLYMNRFQIRPEERLLHRLFGKEYAVYCRLVRRWF